MKKSFLRCLTTASVVTSLALPAIGIAAAADPVTEKNVVTGTMNIDFNTRKAQNKNSDGTVKQGVIDVYRTDINHCRLEVDSVEKRLKSSKALRA